MHSSPAVSVLIPTFNRADKLPATLESVFAQSFRVTEVILADDGSTDNSRQVVESLLGKYPEWRGRFYYFHQPNQGKSVALNNALRRASGDWIAYNDSDDIWKVDKLEEQFEALKRFPDCGVCITDAAFSNGAARYPTAFSRGKVRLEHTVGRIENPARIMAELSHGIYMQTIVVRRCLLDLIGGFDPRLRVAQDADLLFRLSLHTDFGYVNQPLVEIDRAPDGSAYRLTERFPIASVDRLLLHEGMYTKWQTLIAESRPELRSLISRQLDKTRSALANEHLLANDRRSARSALESTLKERFSWRYGLKWILTFGFLPKVLVRFVKLRARTRTGG